MTAKRFPYFDARAVVPAWRYLGDYQRHALNMLVSHGSSTAFSGESQTKRVMIRLCELGLADYSAKNGEIIFKPTAFGKRVARKIANDIEAGMP